ncbi:DUF3093 domain-containing protein [Arthrobacter russicus]|jgi:hypothetical protein|uniref:DUF3093 domain-containing protein n=1 Tax=Arthrobacter russicus TaxID=172040 RepID=A0ABU1JFK1_9MICC|nr:DUF3093 domain-containing protein [Arthrobacter russicus]MDN5669530.1 DUF3093 domain-containing protein [Renibacterium salmoninarum]MDR6271170.1 hypothetical protein [Arthrobacter russicus]
MPQNAPGDHGNADVVYSEKLWPALWIWVVAAGIAVAGILILAPISIVAGYTAAVVIFALEALFLLMSTPRIEVDGQTLTVGRATIDRAFIGKVEGFNRDDAVAQRGTQLNGLAYLCIRGWIGPVVRIEVTDESDPTPYWLTSTRRPEQLVAALTTSRIG